MDVHEIAEQIVQAAAAGAAGVKLRQAEVDAIAADGTLTVRVAGSTVAVSGVRAFTSCDAVAGESVWVIVDGQTIFAIGRIGNAAPACRVYRAAAQAIPNGALTAVQFDTVAFDSDGMYSAGAPTRLTALRSGAYLITAAGIWYTNTAGHRSLDLQVNGTQYPAGASQPAPPNGWNYASHSIATLVELTAGDYVELVVYQDSGGALNLYGQPKTHLAAQWMRRSS